MAKLLLVFLGGGLGSLGRYACSLIFKEEGQSFPTATFVANIFACFLLGFFIHLASTKTLSQQQLLFLATGFCGGFSTFSTFSAENQSLLEARDWLLLSSYIFLSISIGLLMVYLGGRTGQIIK